MPTYEYACRACGHRFEQFQSIKADPIRECPACHEERVERLISGGSGLLFKGSGFYQTDYRSDSYKAGEKGEKGGSEKAGDKSEKPAATPAPAPAPASGDSSSGGSTSAAPTTTNT
ncbi:MAG: FmdB family zinc ribbon protein [Planctomycetota bacterium]